GAGGWLRGLVGNRYAVALIGVVAVAVGAFVGVRNVDPEFRPEIIELAAFVAGIVIIWMLIHGGATSHAHPEGRGGRMYRRALRAAIQHRYAFTASGLVVVVIAGIALQSFQKDFLPDVDEGSVLYMPTTLPGLPTREAGWIVQQMDRKLKQIPEVDRVFG